MTYSWCRPARSGVVSLGRKPTTAAGIQRFFYFNVKRVYEKRSQRRAACAEARAPLRRLVLHDCLALGHQPGIYSARAVAGDQGGFLRRSLRGALVAGSIAQRGRYCPPVSRRAQESAESPQQLLRKAIEQSHREISNLSRRDAVSPTSSERDSKSSRRRREAEAHRPLGDRVGRSLALTDGAESPAAAPRSAESAVL